MFPDLGKIASLLKNAPEMLRQAKQFQGKMEEVQDKLSRLRVEGAAGGGMVTITMNGQQKVVEVKLDPSVVSAEDCEILEDLVQAAINQALEKSKTAASEQMSQMMGDMGTNLPPGFSDLLAKAGGGE
jgi:DNA-binding YbaB/EbfC family protein